MSLEETTVQEAIRNIEQMKRAIGRVEKTKNKNRLFAPNKIGLLVQTGAVCIAAPFFIVEAINGHFTREFLYSAKSEMFREAGIASLAGFLVGLLAILYLVLWDGARKNSEALGDYVSRNFLALSFLSLLSDLFVKFVAISLVLLAAKPEWSGVLMLVFTADYLVQGRLFTLPFKLNIAAALSCVGIATYQFCTQSASLLPALAAFNFLAIASVLFTLRNMRKEQN